MLPDFAVLAGLILALWSMDGPPPASPTQALVGTLLCVMVGMAASRLTAQRGSRVFAEEGSDPSVALTAMRWSTLWPLVAWLAALFLFDWGPWVRTTIPRIAWLGRYLVLLAPGAVLFAVGWASRWQVESELLASRGLPPSVPTARAAARAGFRRNLIAFLPLLVLIGATEGLWVAGELGIEPLRDAARWLDHMPLLTLCVFLGLVLLALPFFPGWVARMLGARPMSDGALRTRLEAGAQAIGLSVGRILVWPTQGRVLNAMVVGVTRRSRTIILSDRLIAEMPPDEVMAVFFHEAGHAKLQHLLLYLFMFFALIGLTYAAEEQLVLAGISPEVVMVLQLALFWFVILGSVSRRFEREADVFGADHADILATDNSASGPPDGVPRGAVMMMRALDRLRQAYGGQTPSHRHGTLDERIGFIGAYATDPDVRASFVRAQRTLRVGVAIALAIALAGIVRRWPTELRRAEASIERVRAEDMVAQAEALEAAGKSEEASAQWAAAHQALQSALSRMGSEPAAPGDRVRLAELHARAGGVAYEGLNDVTVAREHFEKASATLRSLSDEPVRPHVLALIEFAARAGSAQVAARRGNFEVAADDAAKARRAEQRLSVAPETTQTMRAYFADVMRLTRAVVDGHAAAAAGAAGAQALAQARYRLGQLAGGKRTETEWVRLRASARRALRHMPGSDEQ